MRKSLLLYLGVLLSIAVILQNIFVYQSVTEMNGDAKVVNYSGRLRGAVQRLVKLEITYNENNELIEKIDSYLAALRGAENEFGIVFMDDENFQSMLSNLSDIWELLKEDIRGYREGTVTADKLIVVSEEHFKLADQAASAAELCSQDKVSYTTVLIIISAATTAIILLIVAISIVFIKGSEKKQFALIKEKNRQLALANKAKSSFLSNMSHDIRTPLNGIIGMSSTALSNIGSKDKVNDCLNNISCVSNYLLNLLNDILDISKVESGVFELAEEMLYFPDVIKTVVDAVKPLTEAKKQTFNVKVESIAHKYVRGDRLRLNQVYMNILSNAVKFTPEGGKIDLTAMEIAPVKDGCARFLVVCADSGVGMSEDFKEHIFESFTKENASGSGCAEGTGLGMPISKCIVDLMGGKITVESKKGVGTNITIETEFVTGSQSEVAELEQSPELLFKDCDFSGRRILVAEDNELNQQIVSEMLSSTNALVDFVGDGRECLDKFASSAENYYDLILMDIQMPVMTGTGATIAIRALNRADAKKIPIIALTANVFPEDISEVLAAGMDSHIAKPFDFNNVKAIMNKYMLKGRSK